MTGACYSGAENTALMLFLAATIVCTVVNIVITWRRR